MAKLPNSSAYNRLVEEIKLSHTGKLTDLEAHKIARNLMGFCQKLIDINSRLENYNSKGVGNNVDKQAVNGNVAIEL